MKRDCFTLIVLLSLITVMLIGIGVPALAEAEKTETEIAFGLQTVEPNDDLLQYYTDLYYAEKYNFRLIRNIPTAFEAEGWEDYVAQGTRAIISINAKKIKEKNYETLDNLLAARQALVQIASPEDVMWPLWGEDMPETEAELSFESGYDNEDFTPFVLPYVLDNQSAVKGNLIIVSGGGYSSRANTEEGYPTADAFNKLGYNCFLLQRRVAPYSVRDIWMDMQRSVRLVKYQVEKLGLGGSDCICAVGFSGGSATVLGAIAECYGDIQPTAWDADYTSDEIDAYNSDLDVALCIYGPNYNSSQPFTGLITENENLPAMFLVAGYLDTTVDDNVILAKSVEDKTIVENHAFANTPHGFGIGLEGTNSVYWSVLADGFIDQILGAKTAE